MAIEQITESDHSDLGAATEEPRTHLAHLDGLRALAALYVMLHHAALEVWPIYTSKIRPTNGENRILAWFLYGHFAVGVFIVLSGFCLMLPVVKRGGTLHGGACEFFKRRTRRILPPYYLAMGCSLLLIVLCIGHKTGTLWDSSLPVTTKGVLAHLFLIQDVRGWWQYQINGVFWSIAVEWQIYFLFPIIVVMSYRLGGIQATSIVLLLSYVTSHLTEHTVLYAMTFQYYGLFSVGMLAAMCGYSSDRKFVAYRNRFPWVVAVLLATLTAAHYHELGRDWIADYFVGFGAAAVLVHTSTLRESKVRRFLAVRPLAFLGTFAYSIYLIHFPLLQVVWQYVLRPMHLGYITTFALLTAVGCPLILAVSYVFFLVCERPFLSRRAAARTAAEETTNSNICHALNSR